MPIDRFYNEVLTDHNLHPIRKHALKDPNLMLEGVNPSCGDDIVLQLRVKNGRIEDGAFEGDGCAVSQASADIMLEMIVGRTAEEAKELHSCFMRMIRGEASEEEIEMLEEAGALQGISKMPARVKCAVLAWRTMSEMLDRPEASE